MAAPFRYEVANLFWRFRMRAGKSTHNTKEQGRLYWSYEELGIFFLFVALVTLALDALVRFGVLPQSELSHPSDSLQLAVVLLLIGGLFAVLKLRHRKLVVRTLGWVLPSARHLFLSLLAGMLLATGVVLCTQGESRTVPLVLSMQRIITISLLGPVLEETLFRGYLLPLIARAIGNPMAIIVSAGLFALFHGPADIAHGVSYMISGIAYGWIRVASETTTAAAVAHAVYNLVLCSTANY